MFNVQKTHEDNKLELCVSMKGFSLVSIFALCFPVFVSPTDFSSTTSTHEFRNVSLPHHLAGLILARAGSRGIPKKNMANLNGKPLIYYALKAMVDSNVFKTIWVSTDDKDIVTWVGREFPSVFIHPRAAYTATDEASSLTAIQEFLGYHPEVDAIALVQATSPFIQPIYLQQASSLLSKCDSVFAAHRSRSLRWKSVNDPQTEFTFPLNFDPRHRPRRQDWGGEMLESGMFYLARRNLVMKDNVLQGPRSMYVEVPHARSLEIDNPRDLQMAEILFKEPTLTPTRTDEQNRVEL